MTTDDYSALLDAEDRHDRWEREDEALQDVSILFKQFVIALRILSIEGYCWNPSRTPWRLVWSALNGEGRGPE